MIFNAPQPHRAALQALEKDLAAARQAIEVRNADIKEARDELRKLKSTQHSSSRAARGLESQIARLQKQVDDLRGQLAAKDVALQQAEEAANSGQRGHRTAENELSARSARLNRALEEVQRYRRLLEDAKVRLQPRAQCAREPYACDYA